jgi:lysophospholipase L1-like esterase
MFKKLFYILFLIIAVLVILEAVFRIAAYVKTEVMSPSAQKTEGVFTVLCLGDSTTEGLTVEKQYSYPNQLQVLLDKNAPRKKYRVVNLGLSGINSSQLLNRYEKNIQKYRPDLIVMQVGINDPWNMNESNIWRFDQSSPWSQFKLKTDIFFSRFRVYQFIKLLGISYKEARTTDLDDKKQSLAKSFEVSPEKRKQLYALYVYNFGEMVRLAKKFNVPIFFQTYQKEGIGGPRELIDKAYKELAVPIVDNESVFNLIMWQGQKVISKDNFHPNETGYLVIAKNVFNTMVAHGLVAAKPLP